MAELTDITNEDASEAPAPHRVVDKASVRKELMALIAASTDIDDLTGPVAAEANARTHRGELFVVRGEVKEAVKVRAKELGVKITAPMLAAMFVDAKRLPLTKLTEDIDFTEAGVTERMRRKYTGELMYTVDTAAWYKFDANVWKQEPSNVRVVALARGVIKELHKEAATYIDPDAHEQAMTDIKGLQRVAVAKGAAEGLQGEDGILRDSKELDTHANLLCTQNGMVDLETGELLEPDAEALMTMTTACDYDKDAKAPWFLETLKDAFKGSDELVSFFQVLMGYTLLANPKERVMVVPYGMGKNGKSTIFNAIEAALGSHAGKLQAEAIATPAGAIPKSDGEGASPALLKLRGKRVIFSEEIKRGATFNDAAVKKMVSGGDVIQARNLRSNNLVEFKIVGTLICPTNVIPRVYDDDQAVWDRILLLPFTARFDAANGVAPDATRPAKLLAEQEGILAWLVQGALRYQAEGLQVPARLDALKGQERNGSSPINMFLEDECVLREGLECSASELFSAWQTYSLANGEVHVARTSTGFAKHLESQGLQRKKVGVQKLGVDGRVRGWAGLCLKADVPKPKTGVLF